MHGDVQVSRETIHQSVRWLAGYHAKVSIKKVCENNLVLSAPYSMGSQAQTCTPQSIRASELGKGKRSIFFLVFELFMRIE